MLFRSIQRFRVKFPDIVVDVRRVPARQIAVEVQQGSLDFGALTFRPGEEGLLEVAVGDDELVMLVPPTHPFAKRKQVTMADAAGVPVVAHNDPSPARDRVLRMYEQRHAALNIRLSLPSLDSIKRAVEMGLGVALLPRRCALSEISRGHLVEVAVPELQAPRQVRFVYRKGGDLSHAAKAFLESVKRVAAAR